MRIFLVVSPPGNRLQGRSRSLTQLNVTETSPTAASSPAAVNNCSTPNVKNRPKLSRSQLSSCEYFTISFECPGSVSGEELIPATRGTRLADAIRGACAKRGLDLSEVSVLVEPSRTLVFPAQTDTSTLAGRNLVVVLSSGVETPTSTPAPPTPAPVPHPHPQRRQRWSGLFGNAKDTKLEQLSDWLDRYRVKGVPQPSAEPEDTELAASLQALEAEQPPWCAGQQQTALWELVTTEAAYIRNLQVVTELFFACLMNLQSHGLLTEIDPTRLFANLVDIRKANRTLWLCHVSPMLTASRRSRQPLDPLALHSAFMQVDILFEPYARYCAEQSRCQRYCRQSQADSELFTTYLVWCENQKQCLRLGLRDLLVQPMQRLTKYGLLLRAVLKHSEEPQKGALSAMVAAVDEFVYGVNASLRRQHDSERLEALAARLEVPDIIEAKDDELDRLVKSQTEFDLRAPVPGCAPGLLRNLILEGDFKLRDAQGSKSEVRCCLMSDILLVCKITSNTWRTSRSSGAGGGGGGGGGGSGGVTGGGTGGGGGTGSGGVDGMNPGDGPGSTPPPRLRMVRQPYLLDRLVLEPSVSSKDTLLCVYLSELGTAVAAFTLTAQESRSVRSWNEAVKKAQVGLANARASQISRQASSCLGDDDWDDEWSASISSGYYGPGVPGVGSHGYGGGGLGVIPARGYIMGGLAPRSPRGGGSSRGSRVSSLAHSHSGSVELDPAVSPGSSISQSRGVSVDHELSSDSEAVLGMGGASAPNTLAVAPVTLGQSLPNLGPTLLVPQGKLLSPGQRGISYPPPSPPRGALRRGLAVIAPGPPTRNPPLLKTSRIHSPSWESQSVPVVIAGVSPPSEDDSPRVNSNLMNNSNSRTSGTTTSVAMTIATISAISPSTAANKRLSWNSSRSPEPPISELDVSSLSNSSLRSSASSVSDPAAALVTGVAPPMQLNHKTESS